MNKKNLSLIILFLLSLAIVTIFLVHAGKTLAELRDDNGVEFVIPAQGVDQQLARKIALRIARGYGNDNNAVIEGLSQSRLSNLSQSQDLLGTPTDTVWYVTMSGKFTIYEGSILIKAIHAQKMYAIIRARDGEVLAVGTVGPATAELKERVQPEIEK